MARTPWILAVSAVALLLAGTPAHADSRIERELALEPGGSVEVDADGFEVTVSGSRGSGVRVVVEASSDDLETRYDLSFEEDGDTVRVVARKRRDLATGWSWLRGIFSSRRSIALEVPRRIDLRVATSGGSVEASEISGDVRLETSGGSIRAREIEGGLLANTSGGSVDLARIDGDATADTSGGSIRVEEVRGRVTASTSGGSIRARAIGRDLRAETSGGSIAIEAAGGRVEASTSGGSISVEFAGGNAAGGRLETSGGTVRVSLDPEVDLEIVAEATGGVDTGDLPVVVRGDRGPRELRGALGAGGARLEARSSGGSVRFRAIGRTEGAP